jgi:exodeoxyribonuclease VII large subunit
MEQAASYMNSSKYEYISVSELNKLLNVTLEENFPLVYFKGEISGITRASSGHLYFSVKDPESAYGNQVSAVIWKGVAKTLTFDIQEGMSVRCVGKPNIYVVNGRLQMVIQAMFPDGEGLLQQQFLKLKAQLEQEGLFSDSRKRALPFFPLTIGIVTSATGAVIHDMQVKIRERMPSLKVYVYDARVQGDGAEKELAEGVKYFSTSGIVEVIIVARGGGSLQDLWPFNEEVLVRSIFASRVPVISAVGHEVDYTLCDYVADVRAPTPTAAAELVVPHRGELLKKIEKLASLFSDFSKVLEPREQKLDFLEQLLLEKGKRSLERYKLLLATMNARLVAIEPSQVITQQHKKADLLQERLRSALHLSLARSEKKLQLAENSLYRTALNDKFMHMYNCIDIVLKRLATSTEKQLTHQIHLLSQMNASLEALSPMKVLERGYSITFLKEEGRAERIIRAITEVDKGTGVCVKLRDGSFDAEVIKKKL